MIIKYGDGFIIFPDVVWERSESDCDKWVSRPVTAEDTKRRKALANEDVSSGLAGV